MSLYTAERVTVNSYAPETDLLEDWKRFVGDRTSVESLDSEMPYFAQELGQRAAAVSVLAAADNRSGSYKWRGAFNAAYHAVMSGARTFTAASAGNFAMGVALAGEYFDRPVNLFVPETTPQRTRELIASKALSGRVMVDASSVDVDEAASKASDFSSKYNDVALLHPFDNRQTMAGQGTMVDDILRMKPDTQVIGISTGGNGAGSGIAGRLIELGRTDIALYMIQAAGSDGLERSVEAREVVDASSPNRLYRGACVRRVGKHCLEQAISYQNLHVLTVGDDPVRQLAETYMQQNSDLMRGFDEMYEPTTLLAFAALPEYADGKQTVVVGTGKNQSPHTLLSQQAGRTYDTKLMKHRT